MKNNQFISSLFSLKSVLNFAILAELLISPLAFAGHVALANKPLVDTTTSDVLPNLMFVLDNSGSMDRNFTPDWVSGYDDDGFMRIGFSNPTLSKNAAFNSQYYNPNISYTPGVKYDGTSLPSQTSFKTVLDDGYIGATSVTNLEGVANYYAFLPGEFCTSRALNNCVVQAAADKTYKYPATVRWCDTAANALLAVPPVGACQAVRTTTTSPTHMALRTPTPDAKITFTTKSTVSSIKVNGKEILGFGITKVPSSTSTMATNVANSINGCSNAITAFKGVFLCTIAGYRATAIGSDVFITSPTMDTVNPVALTPVISPAGVATLAAFKQVRAGSLVYVDIKPAVTSYSSPGSAAKGTERIDCAGTTCNYNEEMTNYANWWTYYRTRMQGMKSAASLAFKGIDNHYRVGFYAINPVPYGSSNYVYLPINKFESGASSQKQQWYTTLFKMKPDGGTPLRSALVTVGRNFAGKVGVDPMEYACQPNFTLLTTDGYWNGDLDKAVIGVDGVKIPNMDGGSTERPMNEGPPGRTVIGTDGNPISSENEPTLADTAKYYYDTDLRSSAFSNCIGALGTNVCGDGATETAYKNQKMTTLTLGLGADGTLLYDPEYKTQTSGDYFDIKSPLNIKDWPAVTPDSETAIDDLWHAAVNGNGTYFSAKDPQQLTESLKKALLDIQTKVGAGSAASASSLQPTSGDNFNYLASYATVRWTGNLEKHEVDLTKLTTLPDAQWCVEDVPTDSCPLKTNLVSEVTSSGGSQFYCKAIATGLSQASCGVYGDGFTVVGTDCKKAVTTSCTGQLAAQASVVGGRKILINKSGNLTDFHYSALDSTQQKFFEKAWLSAHLSQWPTLNTTQADAAEKEGIVNYLRGQQDLENRPNNSSLNQIFRYREATLGDITESQPAYISKPVFNYTDAGYDAFKTAQTGRKGSIYVGANDGMLHAFDATNGKELWAYVPTPVISNMWKLADENYATNHVNFVNGDPTIGEVFDGSAWKTVLVGGLSGGGRGYYALDITDPANPALLWEFTSANDSNLGYTFGAPVITKLIDGTWVALLSSGYDNGSLDKDGVTSNSPTGDGRGHLFVLDFQKAASKKALKTFDTSVGSASSPSGLSPIAAFVDKVTKNNLATYVYGGDLEGNLWRFDFTSDIKASTAAAPLQIATLKNGSTPQPITTVPQLGVVDKQRIIFVGTGKYLEIKDINEVNPVTQTVYALKDTGTYINDPRSSSSFLKQLINKSTRGGDKTVTNAFSTSTGWWADFPDSGERVNVDPFLVNGVLLMPTIVPSSSSCSPGGYGWFNYFNYKTGGAVPGLDVVSERLDTPSVGFNLVYDKEGKPVVTVVETDDPTPHLIVNSEVANKGGNSRTNLFNKNPDGTYGTKSIWRELIR